jgi:hypothetical protein
MEFFEYLPNRLSSSFIIGCRQIKFIQPINIRGASTNGSQAGQTAYLLHRFFILRGSCKAKEVNADNWY